MIKKASNNPVFIMGDYNYTAINWESLEADSKEREFMNLVQDYFLVQHVLASTRGNNVLDLVLPSEVGMVGNLEICEHFSNSDHNLLVWDLVCKTNITSNNQTDYAIKKGDWEDLSTEFEVIKWEEEMNGLKMLMKWWKML